MWQFEGQCCRTSDQSRRVAASVPSWVSVACPLKLIDWPTTQVRLLAGVSITGVGGVFVAAACS